MRVLLDHFYGSEEHFDLQLVKLNLDLENSREVEAVEKGWALNESKWYNSRLTRISVKEYQKPHKVSGYNFIHKKELTDDQFDQVQTIYETFIRLKGFEPIYKLMREDSRTSWLVAESDGIHAFTMFTEYDGALESNLTAWDYSEPKKSIGRHIIDHEAVVASEKGLEHLYIGPGYGLSAIYKSALKGFEWWTGNEWSKDIDKYVMLCKRDSTITTLKELSELYAAS